MTISDFWPGVKFDKRLRKIQAPESYAEKSFEKSNRES